MAAKAVIKSACSFCNAACGVLVHVQDGVPVKVEGDPEDPSNSGGLCAKGLASLEFLNHPERLKYPMKRLGERGEGRWGRISWDEALETIATRMNEAKSKYGPESVVFAAGAYKGAVVEGMIVRLGAAFGTPNIVRTSSICHFPRILAALNTYGCNCVPDFDHPPSCIIAWGANKHETNLPDSKHLINPMSKGSKLIVVDPRETELAKRAHIWLRPRPSTDLVLAMAMMNVMINEGLYDKAFCEKWTSGFDKLKAHVQDYTPEKAQEITWVPAETIKEAARLYGKSKSGCISWGNGLDHNINNFQSARALACLRAISGNLGKPGGDIRRAPSGVVSLQEMSPSYLNEFLPDEVMQKRISAEDRLLPVFPYSTAQRLVKAILEDKPYPIHALYVMGASPLQTYSHAKETHEALKKVYFWATSDFFMTPSAALADIVLPAATYLEQDSVYQPDVSSCNKPQIQQKVAQAGESLSDQMIMIGLAKKLGLEDNYWADEKDLLDEITAPSGIAFEEAREKGVLVGQALPYFYETDGFPTPSGKVELYSSNLEKWGFDPLPIYHEPAETPYSDPELAKEYPLIATSWKSSFYQQSQGRQIASLRDCRPEPLVEIHPEMAASLGIKKGDQIYIESPRGKIKQKAHYTPGIDPRVVFVDHGWWYPEKGVPEFYGWAESNLNILTDNKKPYAREMGSATLRGFLCKVYKA